MSRQKSERLPPGCLKRDVTVSFPQAQGKKHFFYSGPVEFIEYLREGNCTYNQGTSDQGRKDQFKILGSMFSVIIAGGTPAQQQKNVNHSHIQL